MPGQVKSRLVLPVVLVVATVAMLGAHGAGSAMSSCSVAPEGAALELVYGLEAGKEGVTQRTRSEAAEIVCERLREIGGVSGEVRFDGKQMKVVLPRVGDARRAADRFGVAGRLHFYDWELNLIGRERWVGGFKGAYGAVKLAAEQPTDRAGRVREAAKPHWYALEDRPALSGKQITDPRQELDFFGVPNVTFGFTPSGRVAFEDLTRAIAYRGQVRANGPVSSEQAEALSGHIALVYDNEVMTRPIIDFTLFPDGIDGRTGAQISGGFATVREARDVATILKLGALPINLATIRQETRGLSG